MLWCTRLKNPRCSHLDAPVLILNRSDTFEALSQVGASSGPEGSESSDQSEGSVARGVLSQTSDGPRSTCFLQVSICL